MFLATGGMDISAFQFAILGVAAFALTGLLTWPVRALAIRLGAMDAPNLARKTQAEPVPYLGGVAIIIGVIAISYSTSLVSNFTTKTFWLATSVLGPALLLGLIG